MLYDLLNRSNGRRTSRGRPKNPQREQRMTAVGPSQTIETAAIEDTSLRAFYRDMNLAERRTFWACATGWSLDGMDFMIYPLVIGTIIKLWSVAVPANPAVPARRRSSDLRRRQQRRRAGTAGFAGTATLLSSA